MGNTSSKQTQTTFEPKAPTVVTPKLLQAVSENPETDYVLDQKQQARSQREAARYLEKASQAASQHIDEAYTKLAAQKQKQNDLSAKDLLARVHEIQSELDSRPKRGSLDKAVLSSRQELVECLIRFKDQPLNCYDQFDEFKRVVSS